jgi:hypothetical protein
VKRPSLRTDKSCPNSNNKGSGDIYLETRRFLPVGEKRVNHRWYVKSEEILTCHEAGITVVGPKSVTSTFTVEARVGKEEFIYDVAKNEYSRRTRERLTWPYATGESGLRLHRYWISNCQQCPLKDKCKPSVQ